MIIKGNGFSVNLNVGRPKRLYILVNPYGGKKSASKIFVETMQPLLEDAEIQFTLQGLYICNFAQLHSVAWITYHLAHLCCAGDCVDAVE